MTTEQTTLVAGPADGAIVGALDGADAISMPSKTYHGGVSFPARNGAYMHSGTVATESQSVYTLREDGRFWWEMQEAF